MAYGIEERISKPTLLAFKAMDFLVACSLKNLKALAIENVTAFSYVLLLSFFFCPFLILIFLGNKGGK
jgi:hypothetical protein